MDALNHFLLRWQLFDGTDVVNAQSYGGGIPNLSVDTIAPIARRAVLLDVAGTLGEDVLDADTAITPKHLEKMCRGYPPRRRRVYRYGRQLPVAEYASSLRMPV